MRLCFYKKIFFFFKKKKKKKAQKSFLDFLQRFFQRCYESENLIVSSTSRYCKVSYIIFSIIMKSTTILYMHVTLSGEPRKSYVFS
jgi:hypothetical protein